ncbi:MAG: hypothetical protein IKN53_00925 [Oscillibacter sp.]|nr:hypothetical protein [Oscillibacter sp.]
MKNRTVLIALAATLLLALLCGCGKTAGETPPAEPIENEPEAEAEAEPEVEVGRQDGERFETTVILEGMEETVSYEHVKNAALGFEMDYDYESLARIGAADRERFVSIYEDPDAPENYLEITRSAESADAVAAAVRAELSREYDLLEGTRELAGAGSCLRLEASELKGSGEMAERLQTVYIIPAADGCRVAAAHCTIESAEGFGRRFAYMLDTLKVME